MTDSEVRREPIIRPLCAGDAEALLRFYQGLSEATVHFYEPYRDITLQVMEDVLARVVSGQDVARVLATPVGEIVGHALLMNIAAAEPTLGIGIADRWQNRGFGPRLMAEVLAEADARPEVQAVILTVNKKNTRALALYQRFGFTIYDECEHREPGDSYRMRRPKSAAQSARSVEGRADAASP
ncbi:MAG: GNAT family N-acetyltransferase [Armatimonadota bacterium]|nr:MAG: GNAT family N-acetyltransferase [Armatimonadota bacterium]